MLAPHYRVCPGRMLAEDTLFIAAASVLASFEIGEAVPLKGDKIDYTGGMIRSVAQVMLAPTQVSWILCLIATSTISCAPLPLEELTNYRGRTVQLLPCRRAATAFLPVWHMQEEDLGDFTSALDDT